MIQTIQKSRKEYKCDKCGAIIPKGSKYYRGEINFGPTKIRCTKCGLHSWEMTTSDYLLSVGRVVNMWEEDFGLNDATAEEITSELESIRDDLQERLDNMPEGLQEGDVGQLLQERISGLEDAISELESIDLDAIYSAAVDEGFEHADLNDDDEAPTFSDFDADWEKFLDSDLEDDVRDAATTYVEDELRSAIEDALNCIEM